MWYRMRKTSVLVMALGLLASAAVGCSGRTSGQESGPITLAENVPEASSDTVADDAPNQIVIDNFAFNPPRLTVAAGTKVTWLNRDDVPHTATSTDKPRALDSGTLDTDDRFSHTFTAPGTYKYFCAVHPHMTGEITVK
jgi:plastocyanin